MQRHPFDPRRSGRDAFPCFTSAMQLPLSAESPSDESESGRDGGDDGGCTCDGADDGGCTCGWAMAPLTSLDWSIDGLATLLPRAFSPLSFQTRPSPHTTLHRLRRRRRWSTGTTALSSTTTVSQRLRLVEETPPRSATFFDNESEFGVLRTPAELIERERVLEEQQQQEHGLRIPGTKAMAVGVASISGEYAAWRASPDTAARWRELHRRCVDTIQLCEARLRERQQRLARLPFPATKLKLKRRSRCFDSIDCQSGKCPGTGGSTSPARIPREPLTPVMPTRLSFGSIDLSPIPLDSSQQMAMNLRSADLKTPMSSTDKTPTVNCSTFSSPALSSIAEHASDVLTPSFASLQFSPSRELETHDEEEKENQPHASQEESSSSSASSLKAMSSLHASPYATPSSDNSGASSPPSFVSSFTSPPHVSERAPARDDVSSITRRQQSFIAAIEEEAQARDAVKLQRATKTADSKNSATEESESDAPGDDTTVAHRVSLLASSNSAKPNAASSSSSLYCSPPATSIASIYKEARALGITEPTAQWEYVQLIRRHTQRGTRQVATPASRVSF